MRWSTIQPWKRCKSVTCDNVDSRQTVIVYGVLQKRRRKGCPHFQQFKNDTKWQINCLSITQNIHSQKCHKRPLNQADSFLGWQEFVVVLIFYYVFLFSTKIHIFFFLWVIFDPTGMTMRSNVPSTFWIWGGPAWAAILINSGNPTAGIIISSSSTEPARSRSSHSWILSHS